MSDKIMQVRVLWEVIHWYYTRDLGVMASENFK